MGIELNKWIIVYIVAVVLGFLFRVGIVTLLKDISEKIEENEKEIDNKRRNVSAFLKKSEGDLKPFDYLDYYTSTFPQKKLMNTSQEISGLCFHKMLFNKLLKMIFTDVPVR